MKEITSLYFFGFCVTFIIMYTQTKNWEDVFWCSVFWPLVLILFFVRYARIILRSIWYETTKN